MKNSKNKNAGVCKFILVESDGESQNKIPQTENQIIDLASTSQNPILFIYHISDLHIENNPNSYEEYNYVFSKLYNIVRGNPLDNKIMVITGDILHERNKLSTDIILFTWNLFKKFSEIIPIIMIPGNHDINMRNKDKKDGVYGIIYDRLNVKTEIKYLFESGFYKYRNLLFCVHSLYDDKNLSNIKINDPNLIKIGLHHGILDGTHLDQGFTFSRNKKIADFIDYDFTLLGDIHSFQFLNQNRNIAYAGSLICQNFGECESKHGCILWDLEKKQHKFIPIENIYTYEIFNIYNRSQIEDFNFNKIPEKGKVKLKFYGFEDQASLFILKKQLKQRIKEKYKDVFICFEEVRSKSKLILPTMSIREKNTNDLSNTYALLERFLFENYKDSDINYRKNLFDYLQTQLSSQTSSCKNKAKIWNITRIEWENLFCYGENNKVEFQKLKNTTGILGRNSSGKSLFIKSLIYLLYGRDSLQESTKFDLINKEKNYFSGKIVIEVEGNFYLIERKGRRTVLNKKDQNSFEDDLKIELISEKSNKNLTKPGKRESQRFINDLIGNYADLKRINFLLQNEDEKFLNLKRKEKKEYLYKILNLDFFENVNSDVKNEISVLNKKKAILESKIKDKIDANIDFSQEYIDKLKIELNEKQDTKSKILKEGEEIYSEIKKLNRQITPNIIMTKTKKQIYEENRKNKEFLRNLREKGIKKPSKSKFHDLSSKKIRVIKSINRLKRFANYTNEKIIRIKKEMDVDNKSLTDYLRNMANDFKIIKKILEGVKNDEIIEKNEIDKINLGLIDEICEINETVNYKNDCLKTLNEEQEKQREEIEKLINKKGKIIKSQTQIKDGFAKFSQLKQKQKRVLEQIHLNQSLLIKFRRNQMNQIKNESIENYLRGKENLRLNNEKNLLNCVQEIESLKKNIEMYEQNFNSFNQWKNELDKTNSSLSFYNDLLEITSVNGFNFYLLNLFIQEIEEKMNEVFEIYFNKKIKIILEKDSVDFLIINEEGKNCSLMGGCEGLLFELAFRISIAKIMKIPFCGTLFIDEHLSVIDSERRDEIKKIFQHINCYFEKIIVITHDETIKNYTEICLTIDQKGNFSYLRF